MIARRLRFGLATVLGIAPRGFFIPYRYADRVPSAGDRPSYAAIGKVLHEHTEAFRVALSDLDGFADELNAIGGDRPPAPRWDQDWFPRLDAAMAYAMVRRLAPRRIVEVGSGHSTRFLARAVADGGLTTDILSIDPAPRADLSGLRLRVLRAPVQETGTAPFAELGAGDMLFIDSNHIAMPGTDVDFLLNHVLPALASGVYIHIHDVFLPDDYPADWAWRGYNEQLCVAALIHGGGYRPVFASHYVVMHMNDELRRGVVAGLPLLPDARESSLWLEKH